MNLKDIGTEVGIRTFYKKFPYKDAKKYYDRYVVPGMRKISDRLIFPWAVEDFINKMFIDKPVFKEWRELCDIAVKYHPKYLDTDTFPISDSIIPLEKVYEIQDAHKENKQEFFSNSEYFDGKDADYDALYDELFKNTTKEERINENKENKNGIEPYTKIDNKIKDKMRAELTPAEYVIVDGLIQLNYMKTLNLSYLSKFFHKNHATLSIQIKRLVEKGWVAVEYTQKTKSRKGRYIVSIKMVYTVNQ